MKTHHLLGAVLVPLLGLLLSPPALAQTAQPTSIGIAEPVRVYRGYLEAGDMLVIVRFHITYTTIPALPASETYLIRMVSGTTTLASTTPNQYFNKGYHHGVATFYFTKAKAPAWGGAYTIVLEGNPTLTWASPGPPKSTASSFVWFESTATLMSYILQLADALEEAWGINVVETTTAGAVLTSYGQEYFSAVFPQLRVALPKLFPGGVEAPLIEKEPHARTYEASLLQRWRGTGIDVILEELAGYFGMSAVLFATLLSLVLVVVVGAVAAAATGSPAVALLAAAPTVVLLGLLGLLPLTVVVLLALMATALLGYAFFFRGAG